MRRILIVDDVSSNRKLMALFMQDLGFHVLFAENGEETLQLLDKETCDVILMDLNMPKLDGMKTIEAIRNRNTPIKNVPIIVLSAFGSKQTREQGFLLGVTEFLLKPVDFPALENILRALHLVKDR